jgi:hypothetical protein
VVGEGRHDQPALGPFRIGMQTLDLAEELGGIVGAAALQLRLACW